MNIALFYFSGTGNTWWAGKEIKKRLEKCNSVEMYSVENSLMKDQDFLMSQLKKADHIILGYPVYASRMPEPLHNFINELPIRENPVNVSVFVTQSVASGDGAIYDYKRLKEKGLLLKQTLYLKMGNNYYIPQLRISPVRGKEHIEKLNNRALGKISSFCNDIENIRKSTHGLNPFGITLGVFQRAFFSTTIGVAKKNLLIDADSCTKCKLCEMNCPVGNIDLTGNSFGSKCISCMRCYNFCPKNAVLFGEKTRDTKIFYRYKGPVKLNLRDLQI